MEPLMEQGRSVRFGLEIKKSELSPAPEALVLIKGPWIGHYVGEEKQTSLVPLWQVVRLPFKHMHHTLFSFRESFT